MKKSKVVSAVMALTTFLSTATPVLAADLIMSPAPDYSVMPIAEVYDDYSTMVISEMPVEEEIKVLLNDEEIEFADDKGKVTPVIINGRTMVPLRKIFETLGATVDWNSDTNTAYAIKDDLKIELQIGNDVAKVTRDGEVEEVKLDSAPVVIDGRTLAPVRFVSEELGLKVGWNEDTQTVILLNPNFVIDIIKEEAPIFYEIITAEYETPKTSKVKMNMTGNIKYTNTEDRTANTNVKLVADGKMSANEEAVEVDMTFKTTGKGELFEAVKEDGLDKVTMAMIVDMKNFTTYVKSSLLESEIGTKWVKQELVEGELAEMEMAMANATEKVTLEDTVDLLFDFVEIDETTYSSTGMLTRILCQFVNDDHFKVTGRTTKTYTYEMTLKDFNDIFEGIGAGEVLPEEIIKDAKIKFTMKVQDKLNTEASFNLDFDAEYGAEKIEADFAVKSVLESYNKDVTIKMPDDKDVYELDEIYEDSTVSRAEYALFANYVHEVQQSMDIAYASEYGNRKANGENVSAYQVRNYIANGGEAANASMLSIRDANEIACTKITDSCAKEILGFDLPQITVNDKNGNAVDASFYLTKEGDVFVWPPFESENNYFVSGAWALTDENGDLITSENGEKVFKNGYTFEMYGVTLEVGKDIK